MAAQSPRNMMGQAKVYRVLGSYRFMLAILVFASHSAMWLGHGISALALGNVGVMSFFVLSGFVIAEALDIFYCKSAWRFAANRFLKLYPTYWIVAAMAVAVFAYAGHPLPITPLSVLTNFTIVLGHLKIANGLLFISVAWAVIVELFFYTLFAIVWFGSRGNGTVVALAGGFFLLCYAAIVATDQYGRSFSFLRHAPYFVLGVSYYWALVRGRAANFLLVVVSLCLSIHSYYIYNAADPQEETILSLLLFATSLAVFAVLACVRSSDSVKRIDRRLGDYTYAVYLVHWVVIELLSIVAWADGTKFLAALLGSIALAIVINLLVERPLVRLRTHVRGRSLYGS